MPTKAPSEKCLPDPSKHWLHQSHRPYATPTTWKLGAMEIGYMVPRVIARRCALSSRCPARYSVPRKSASLRSPSSTVRIMRRFNSCDLHFEYIRHHHRQRFTDAYCYSFYNCRFQLYLFTVTFIIYLLFSTSIKKPRESPVHTSLPSYISVLDFLICVAYFRQHIELKGECWDKRAIRNPAHLLPVSIIGL